MTRPAGWSHTAEAREKIAAANRARLCSDATRAKLSAVTKGRPKSAETRAKLSAANTGRALSDAHKAALSAAFKGVPRPPEVAARIIAANRARAGVPVTEDSRARLRASAALRADVIAARARREAEDAARTVRAMQVKEKEAAMLARKRLTDFRPATARVLSTLHAARAARTEAAGWGEATIAQLRALWDEGHSASVIGLKLKKSKNAIIGKAHRLHLPPRPAAVFRSASSYHVPRPIPAKRAPAVTLPRLASVPVVVAPPPPPLPPLPPRVRRASDAPCCWPTTVNGRHRMLCEAPAEGRGSYCAAHQVTATAGVQMRPKQQAKLLAAHG